MGGWSKLTRLASRWVVECRLRGAGDGDCPRQTGTRSATRLHTVLLDVVKLTEHADNAMKFLSDMFSARHYKLAALTVGVPD